MMNIKRGLISGIAIGLVLVLLVGALGFISGGFRNWDYKTWFKNVSETPDENTAPTVITCNGTVGQEVEIVNRIQADIDKVNEETNEYTKELSYKLDGTLNVSSALQFENGTSKSVMAFDFLNNQDCKVTIDFTDCTLTKKSLTNSANNGCFILTANGGTLNINGAEPKYTFSTIANIFYAIDRSVINATNCTVDGTGGTSMSLSFNAFYAGANGIVNATDCVASGNISGTNVNFKGFYATSGGVVNAKNCTTGGSANGTGSSYYAFFAGSGGIINATDCMAGGKNIGGGSFFAFYVNAGKIDAKDCKTGGSASSDYSYYVFSAYPIESSNIVCTNLYVNTPASGVLKMSLGSSSTYNITKSRFPDRKMSGIPQTDTTTGTQIWNNNTYA